MNPILVGFSLFFFFGILNFWAWTPLKYIIRLPIAIGIALLIMVCAYVTAYALDKQEVKR